ncbi:MAG TPA: sulfotransferase [Actinomycetota bacterium]
MPDADHRPDEERRGRAFRRAARSQRRRRAMGLALRVAAPILPRRPPPRQPIFILGSPRSGTTVLFDVLSRHPDVRSLEVEGHLLWELFHSPKDRGWTSHATRPQDITRSERRALYWAIDRIAGPHRYLDKTPRNSLRVPYLQALFPDARFVYLKRDGRAAVNSLLNAWRSDSGMFPGLRARTPIHIEGARDDRWRLVAPPGWQDYATGHDLPEVCAFQWTACNESILRAREAIPAAQWVEVSYEDFVARPVEQAERLVTAAGLSPSDAVLSYAGELDRHVSKAVTPPRPDKWRDENPQDIARILPVIEPTMRRLGYVAS